MALSAMPRGTEGKVGSSMIHPGEFDDCLKRENLNLRTSKCTGRDPKVVICESKHLGPT